MSDINLTPFMNLPAPEVGVEPGPQWAQDLNDSLTIVDQHNHAPGSGVQINPSGININTSLPFNNNPATSLMASVYTPQTSLATLMAVYVIGADLYYNDANGNAIQITISGHVNSGNGSISGLVSPASASYSAPNFIFQSNVNTPANIDGGSFIFRNIVANSKGLTLSPPNAMGANYTITLPSLPATQSILTLDTAGNMVAAYTVDSSSIVINSNVIKVGTITNSNIVDGTISGLKITPGTIPSSAFSGGVTTQVDTFTASGSWTCPAGVTAVTLFGAGGGGAGGSGAGLNGASAGGGFGAVPASVVVPVTPATVYTITIGAGGLRAGTTASGNSGSPGGNGQNSTFGTLATFLGAPGGPGGAISNVTNIFTPPTAVGFFAYGGTGSRNELTDNANGNASFYAAGGAKGVTQSGASAGGGGGGAGFGAGGAGANGAAANGNGRDAASTNTNPSSGGGGGSGGDDSGSATGGRGQPGGDGIILITYPKFD